MLFMSYRGSRLMSEERDEGTAIPESLEGRIARLSEGQRDCLLLVDQHMSSKEIAVRLGISPHTVDQRIRQALQILGVERRGEAARMIAASSVTGTPSYQRLIHQSPYIDANLLPGHDKGAVSHLIRHADRAGEAGPSGVISEQKPAGRWLPLPMPFATRNQPSNEMGIAARLLWIVLIAFGAAFSAGMYLAGLESLSRMIAS